MACAGPIHQRATAGPVPRVTIGAVLSRPNQFLLFLRKRRKAMSLEFETAEDLYQHYQAVAHRLQSRRYVYPVDPVAKGYIPPAVKTLPKTSAAKAAAATETFPTLEEYFARIEAGELVKSPATGLRLVRLVAMKHNLLLEDLLGPRRKRPIVIARQEAYWWLYQKVGFSALKTGELMGKRDHTSVLQGVPQHEKRMAAQK